MLFQHSCWISCIFPAAKIERLDSLLGEYLAAVAKRGEAGFTVTCLASDHGEMLADRGATAKSKPVGRAAAAASAGSAAAGIAAASTAALHV